MHGALSALLFNIFLKQLRVPASVPDIHGSRNFTKSEICFLQVVQELYDSYATEGVYPGVSSTR